MNAAAILSRIFGAARRVPYLSDLPEEARPYVKRVGWSHRAGGYIENESGDYIELTDEGKSLVREATEHLPSPFELMKEAAARRGLTVEFHGYGYNSLAVTIIDPRTGVRVEHRFGD